MAGHRYCLCPYFQRTMKNAIFCENGTRFNFKDGEGQHQYYEQFCCDQWQGCTVAKALNDFYEREAKNE